jgi:hypothetical protein
VKITKLPSLTYKIIASVAMLVLCQNSFVRLTFMFAMWRIKISGVEISPHLMYDTHQIELLLIMEIEKLLFFVPKKKSSYFVKKK